MRKTNFIYIWLNTRHAYTLIWLCEFLFFCVSWKIPLFQSRLNKQAVKLLEMLIVLLLMWIGNIYSIAIGKSTWHNNSWFLPSTNWAAKPFAGKKVTFSTIIFHKFSYQYAFFFLHFFFGFLFLLLFDWITYNSQTKYATHKQLIGSRKKTTKQSAAYLLAVKRVVNWN